MPIADLIAIPTVQAFLMDGSVMTVFEAVLEKFGLGKERAAELLDLTDAVLDGEIDLVTFPELIAEAFGVEEARAKRMACDVVGFRLLPLDQYVPGVAERIVEWGGDLNKYPKSKVGKLKMSAETFAGQLDEQLGFDFSEVLLKRCAFLLGAYWTGEKTKESTVTFFSRAASIGGLGLSPEQSQGLLEAIDAQREMIELDADTVKKVVVNSGEEAVAAVDKAVEEMKAEGVEETSDVTSDVMVAPSHEVAAEIPVVSRPVMVSRLEVPVVVPVESVKMAKRMQEDVGGATDDVEIAVGEVMVAIASILASRRIAGEVVAEVVRKALKGVRDLYQTRDVLERIYHLDGEDLEKVTEAIEDGHRKIHGQNGQDGQSLALGQMKEGEEKGKKEENVLDQRFAALTKGVSEDHVEEVMPGARVSLARTVEEESSAQVAAIAPEKIAEAEVASRPEKVAPMLTVGSVAPDAGAMMTDIRPVRRLVGPVDELGGMTPTEFRRLSTTPADATQKIEDILSTLEAQSFEERVMGVKAWRNSPMNQLYVSMTSDALQLGVSLAEIATKRRSAGEESLSPAEIRALGMLNEKLRF